MAKTKSNPVAAAAAGVVAKGALTKSGIAALTASWGGLALGGLLIGGAIYLTLSLVKEFRKPDNDFLRAITSNIFPIAMIVLGVAFLIMSGKKQR